MTAAGKHAELAGAIAPAATSQSRFVVTITDSVDYSATVTAPTRAEASAIAFALFESSERTAHFTEQYNSSHDIEEIE